MPWGDWQFWVATAGALVALWAVARPLLPRQGGRQPGAARPRRTALTIGDTDAGGRGVSGGGSRGPAQGPPAS
jgi:hypothetical protein